MLSIIYGKDSEDSLPHLRLAFWSIAGRHNVGGAYDSGYGDGDFDGAIASAGNAGDFLARCVDRDVCPKAFLFDAGATIFTSITCDKSPFPHYCCLVDAN